MQMPDLVAWRVWLPAAPGARHKGIALLAQANFSRPVAYRKKGGTQCRPFKNPTREGQAEVIFRACLPLGPCAISNATFWPSFRVLKPAI